MRIWLEHKNEINFDTPNSEQFKKIINEYNVTVKIEELEKQKDTKQWKIEISDKGIGISTEELKYLMKTGSSSKDVRKRNMIEEMPIWMRPSGTFGIGFQSIFMLTDVIEIETKSFFNEEYQIIELNNPNSVKDGDILIRKSKTNHLTKPGTKLSFVYKVPVIPEWWSIKGEHNTASAILRTFDPFIHESLDIDISKVIDEVYSFSEKSYLPIEFVISDKKEFLSNSDKRFSFYEEDNSLEINFLLKDLKDKYSTKTYYKSQSCSNDLRIDFLGLEINIHNAVASEVLSLDRNKIKPKYGVKLYDQVIYSTYKVISKNFDKIFIDSDEKVIGSMFLNYYEDHAATLKTDLYDKYWKEYKLNVDDQLLSISDLLAKHKIVKLINDVSIERSKSFNLDIISIKNDCLEINIHGAPYYNYVKFIVYKVQQEFPNLIELSKDKTQNIFVFSKDTYSNPFTTDLIIKLITNHNSSYARYIIPCNAEFEALRLNDEARKPYVSSFIIDYALDIKYPKMISPFVRISGDRSHPAKLSFQASENFINWVYENRYDQNTSKDDIEKAYKMLKEKVDTVVIAPIRNDE